MKVITSEEVNLSESILAIGVFDGLHKGHRLLIKNAKSKAKKERVPLVVYTFDPPPKVYFEKSISLMSLDKKLGNLSELGVDYTIVANFDSEYRKREKKDFIKEIKKVNPLGIFVGENFSFGYQQKGNIDVLKEDFKVYPQKLLCCNKEIVISSSRIKKLIKQNLIKEANELY